MPQDCDLSNARKLLARRLGQHTDQPQGTVITSETSLRDISDALESLLLWEERSARSEHVDRAEPHSVAIDWGGLHFMDSVFAYEVIRVKVNVWRLTGEVWFLGPVGYGDVKEPLRSFVHVANDAEDLSGYRIHFGDADQSRISVPLPERWMYTIRYP